MSEKAIKVTNLGKSYFIGSAKSGSLREGLSNMFKGFIRGKSNLKEEFWALRMVDFDVNKGQALGIIGKNGAGKSTLLKLLSRITDPTEGRFEIEGRISSLLEVGTGFHPELSGRENIYLNGTILGMKRREIKNKFDEIVSFSGVEKFIDTAVKHYSSGMKVRLAFAVAAHLEPEILIVDEVLAVGDAEFQKKCLGKMQDVSENKGRTVLFVSHNMGAIASLCPNSILLNLGQVESIDSTDKIISKYLSDIERGTSYKGLHVKLTTDNILGWNINTFLNLEITWENEIDVNEDTCIDIACYTFDSVKVFAFQSDRIDGLNLKFAKSNSIIFRIMNPGLPNNMLFFDLGLRVRGSGTYDILLQKCLNIIPGISDLPNYSRNDTIIIPEVKFSFPD